MIAVIFDIDGTLTRTNRVDHQCYLAAFHEVAGQELTDDFHAYPHVTDGGILETAWQRMFGRSPGQEEVERMKAAFLARLEAAWAADPGRFKPLPGAGELLAELKADQDLALGLATGCWRSSAVRKLAWAGLETKDLPLAGSDETPSRVEIIRACLGRAARERGGSGFEAAVYVGDGPWDLAAAKELGLGFIGVGKRLEAKAPEMVWAGEDWNGSESFPRLLDLACRPG